jgi:hypothetical protein
LVRGIAGCGQPLENWLPVSTMELLYESDAKLETPIAGECSECFPTGQLDSGGDSPPPGSIFSPEMWRIIQATDRDERSKLAQKNADDAALGEAITDWKILADDADAHEPPKSWAPG